MLKVFALIPKITARKVGAYIPKNERVSLKTKPKMKKERYALFNILNELTAITIY